VDEAKGVAQILYRHGIVADADGDVEAAVAHYRSALELKPGYAKCHLNLGVDLARLGRREEGLAHLVTAERLDPEYYRAPFNQGIVLEELGRPDEAMAAYRRAVGLEPRYLLAQLAEAELLLAADEREAARERLATIDAYDDRWFTDAHEEARLKARGLTAFVDELDRLEERGLGDCFSRSSPYRRAELAWIRGNGDVALEQLRRAFENGLACAEGYRLLGAILVSRRETAGALDAYRRAVAAEPRLPSVHLGLALLAAGRGDGATAMAELEEEIRWNPERPEPYLEAGLVQELILGDPAAAADWYARYEEAGGDPARVATRRDAVRRARGGR